MSRDVFAEIRGACRSVTERARHVHIRTKQIDSYAASLPIERAVAPALDPATHFLGEDRDTIAFFLMLDSINFGSGFFPHLSKRPGMSGYFTVASSLTDHFRAHGPIPSQRLTDFSAADCARIFGQSLENPVQHELMQLFAHALRDLGCLVQSEFGGLRTNLIEAAGHSARKLLGILTHMKFFQDVEHYGLLAVPFYKRAQLTAADLSLALNGRGLGRFDDLDHLTIFADNLVPHVLRRDGVLEYEPNLAERIDCEELIPPGSEEEIEIRAAAVDVAERIVQSLRGREVSVTSMGIDYVLWNRGQAKHYKTIKPRHRTRTVYY